MKRVAGLAAAEKRSETRQALDAKIRFFFDDAGPVEVQGRLMDLSRSGFRAAHGHYIFRAGQEVGFRLWGAEGRARVVWNRLLPGNVESGFLILEGSPAERASAARTAGGASGKA